MCHSELPRPIFQIRSRNWPRNSECICVGQCNTSVSFHKKLGLRLAHNNCDCREFYPRTVYIYIFIYYWQSLNLLSLPRVIRSCTCERKMLGTVPLLMNRSCTCEQDLLLTSAAAHVNGPIAQGNAIRHEIHISISTYHAIPRQTLSYTMPGLPGHTGPYHTSRGQRVYHAMPARRYHIPCHISIGHTIYHVMPTRIYHVPCKTSPVHTIYYVMPDRSYHALPRQANTYTMRCPPSNTICHARKTTPYIMPCPPWHTIYHAKPAKQCHIPCHARKAIPYTIPCLPGHTIYHARHAKPNHMPCHTG